MMHPSPYFKSVAVLAAIFLGGAGSEATAQQISAGAPSALTETYGDWVVRCVTPAASDGQAAPLRLCEMAQQMLQKDSNKRIMSLSLRKSPDAETGTLTVVAPFGILLSAGVQVEVAETSLLKMGFQTCLPSGCIARSGVTADEISVLATGDVASLVLADTSNQPLRLITSLAGFGAAWNRLNDF